MTPKPLVVCALAVALVASTFTLPVSADSATEAQLQYELGAELYRQGRYAEALERFVASHRLVPNANVVLNIVQTFAYLNRHEEAYNWNETLIEVAKDDSQRQSALSRRSELGKKVAVIDATTSPPGAELFVDRTELGSVGHSPRRIAVKPGDHTVIARLANYDDATMPTRVGLGSTTSVALQLRPVVGVVRVSSDPAGATIRDELSGRVLGKTPIQLQLPVGESSLALELAGWVSQTKRVAVTRESPVDVAVTLQRAASSVAVLSVNGNVDGATVFFDGRPVGVTPLSLGALPAGVALLDIRAPGREPWSGRVSLEQGAATRVTYDLVDPNDKPWSGWRWLGYGAGGALLATGAVFGLMAKSARSDFERDPSSDSLDAVESRNLTADILMGAGVLTIGATLTWDLLRAPELASSGTVSVDR